MRRQDLDSASGPASDRAAVRLLASPRRAPETAAERCALDHLGRRGEVPLGALVDAVARDLHRDVLRHGGWAAEIGDAGRGLFVADAVRAVREGDGVLWAIGGPAGEPPAKPPETAAPRAARRSEE